MPITPGTITLTNSGTVALDLSTYGSITVETPIVGIFAAGNTEPEFICEVGRVLSFGETETAAYNSVGFCDLNSGTPLTILEDTVSPQSSGYATILVFNSFGFLGENRLSLNTLYTPTAGYQVNWDNSASGTMTQQDSVAALSGTHQFTPSTMFPYCVNGHVGFVVDGQGTVFDLTNGTYEAATFFPILNGAGNAPATASSFDGGFTDTNTQHSFFVVSAFDAVSPFTQLPSLVEETDNNSSVQVYTYAFNNSAIPGDVYNIIGNTPNGFFFTDGTNLIEVDPTARTYTTYVFTPQDDTAATCLSTVVNQYGLYAATKDSSGAWWFTDSANQNSCSGGQTQFNFATTAPPPPTPTDCCVPLPSATLGRWRGNVGLNCYGKTLIGDAFSGVIGFADFNTFQEYGNTMRGLIAAPPIHSDRKRIFMPKFELDIESGVGAPDCCGSEPVWLLDWSKDGGRTWSEIAIPRSMGRIGAYTQRLRWLRLGQARQWVLRLTSTDPVRRVIIGTYVDTYEGMG